MAFEPQHSVTRNPQIREIEIVLFRTTDLDHSNSSQSVRFRITIDDQFGHAMNHLHGSLLPHLTQVQVQNLLDFMDAMWAKAQDEMIGEG